MKAGLRAAAVCLVSVLCMFACSSGGGRGSNGAGTELSIAEVVQRDADGNAVRLGETATTEGVVTVGAGVFANNKLKVFLQDGADGILLYHQSAADIEAFDTGDRLRVTGVVRQQDPTSDANPATGTVHVDVTAGEWSILSTGNALPEPQPVDFRELEMRGDVYTGTLVRVADVQKVGGDWPVLSSRSTQVDVSDDGGTTVLVLRFQRNTIDAELVDRLEAIGDGAFDLTGIFVQDDVSDDGRLLDGYEIWVRGATDIES